VRDELPPILAVGAHLKCAVALSVGRQVFLSQHIGDLETPEARAALERTVADLTRLYETRPVVVAHDLHPGYASTAFARATGLPLLAVQHHHAHLASCLAENGGDGEALGVTWDGTGLGDDGTVWGGEMLLGSASAYRRVAHLRPFRLPGGEAAIREPRRVALALLLDVLGPSALERLDLPPVAAFQPPERRLLARLLETGTNAPVTTSAGRLFDGVASLLGLSQRSTFEGQAAMALEAAAGAAEESAWPLPLDTSRSPAVLDWRELVAALLDGRARREDPARMAARFHNALAAGIEAVARHVGERRVALSGGCFQNALLTERAADRLEAAGFQVLLHREVPAGDGGICLGQVAVAAARLQT
jgi:hydrogenase maturation protein HypF